MQELIPGISKWTVVEGEHLVPKGAFFVNRPAGSLVVDPVLGREELEAIKAQGTAKAIVLLTASHVRHTADFAAELGLPVWALATVAAKVKERVKVDRELVDGEELLDGVKAVEIAVTGEMALYVPAGAGTVVVADALMARGAGEISLIPPNFVPDQEAVKASLRKLLQYDFGALLVSHGQGVTTGGREVLQRLLG
ncbi:MAG: hypothetical protein D9V47_10390 [Clostridia bacterium]|nr:MAG: hypothetical protein D9V47_10390 [Clostridia bacterium]